MSGPRGIGSTRQTGTSGPLIGSGDRLGSGGGVGRTTHRVPPERVFLTTIDGRLSVDALLGEDGATPDDTSYGGWEEVPIPGDRARLVWTGVGVPKINLALILNGWPNNSVEAACAVLERMAGFTPGFDEREPPKLRVYGAGIPHDHHRNPSYRWVISALSWVDPVIRLRHGAQVGVPHIGSRQRYGRQGSRVRQGVALTLSLHDEPDAIERLRPRRQHPKTRHATVTHKLNTYRKLAKHYLDAERLGRKLAELNGARDPDRKLKPGRQIKLPSRHTEEEWKRDLRRRRK
jgi:hypothetical protein